MLADEIKAGNRVIVPETFAPIRFARETPLEKPELVRKARQWMEIIAGAGTWPTMNSQ